MLIGGLAKTSIIDYPKKIAAVVFLQGCNFRCPYCHNPELVKCIAKEPLSEDFIIDFLNTRKGKLDAVVISGGEPTLHHNLEKFILKIKDVGFLVKLDTNGTNPGMVKRLIEKKLVDYIAMDIKGPLKKYPEIVKKDVNIEDIYKTMQIIIKSGVEYEFRTTVVKEQLNFNDFLSIRDTIKIIGGADKYYLQRFIPSKLLDENYSCKHTYSDDEFLAVKNILNEAVKQIFIR